jgi:hypothetical protein
MAPRTNRAKQFLAGTVSVRGRTLGKSAKTLVADTFAAIAIAIAPW